jgi:hypothetical protein
MARTYAWLQDDAPQPKEIALRIQIERYGAKAITGRDVLPARFVRDLLIAQNVEASFNSRAASENWGAWEMDINNRHMAQILKAAFKEYQNE